MSKRLAIIGLTLLAAGAITAGVLVQRARRPAAPPAAPSAPAEEDPRLTFDTPYKNVRPDVAYVGDAACVGCHAGHDKIAEHYAHHPMGRALALATDSPESRAGRDAAFDKNGYRYRVAFRDGKVFHREERLDASGKVVAATEAEARYALGSGTRGKSYLVERDGRLFQSPISWFGEKKIWDLSPGYPADLHFNRPVIPQCLFCHCNQAEPAEGTLNAYREPVFRGLAIGCERCHGPGELHVKARESGDRVPKPDHTIVNPRHLAPELRDAVCQQCHLQGEQRVLPRGRGPFDFRPGLPLELFWTVFVRQPKLTASHRSVGQVEQLELSKCHQASAGKLGCISCHDPHRRPEASERVAFFRDRCLQCHQQKGCTEDRAVRTKHQDSCMDCHMSKEGSRNIPHTAVTDHRILRRPEAGTSTAPPALARNELPVTPFRGKARDADRDLGVALAQIGHGLEGGDVLAGLARPLLQRATQERPDDVAAWEARAVVLWQLGLPADALKSAEQALALKPELESALRLAAELNTQLNRPAAAIDYWRRATAVNPHLPGYHLALARLLARRGDWPGALQSCDAALKLEPINTEARALRVTCLVRTGDRDRARSELATLLAMRPRDEADLRRSFESLLE